MRVLYLVMDSDQRIIVILAWSMQLISLTPLDTIIAGHTADALHPEQSDIVDLQPENGLCKLACSFSQCC